MNELYEIIKGEKTKEIPPYKTNDVLIPLAKFLAIFGICFVLTTIIWEPLSHFVVVFGFLAIILLYLKKMATIQHYLKDKNII